MPRPAAAEAPSRGPPLPEGRRRPSGPIWRCHTDHRRPRTEPDLLLLLTAHLAAAPAASVLVRWLGRRAFLVLAHAPACAVVRALRWTREVMNGDVPVESTAWVPHLGMSLSFERDPPRPEVSG